MVVFKMRDSVPSARYSSICNVLHQWSISLIPTYTVYLLYDIYIYIYLLESSSTPDYLPLTVPNRQTLLV